MLPHLLLAEVTAAEPPRARDLLHAEAGGKGAPRPFAPASTPPAVGDLIVVEQAPDGDWRQAGAPVARAGSGLAALHRLAAHRQLAPLHGAEARAEVAALEAEPGVDDPALRDLTDLPFVTIDNADTRDLDQALYLQRSSGGGLIAYYALADAAHFVRPGMALWREALARGSSYYLPGLTIPMLPATLSEGLVSLNADGPRRALVFRISVDAAGQAQGTELVRARIHSRAKLSYAGVQAFYDDRAGSAITSAPYAESLELLRELGERRLADARRRDVVQYHREEVAVRPRAEGGFELVRDPRLTVERYNEQLSLLCNVEGARFLVRAAGDPDVQAVFRRHPAPEPARLDELADRVAALGEARGAGGRRWTWDRAGGESLADYLERLPDGRLRQAIERQAMMTGARSLFAPEPGLHYGIGAPCYARFSAPMREIVGIFTHKEALEGLGAIEPQPPAEDLERREAVMEAANRAKSVQRELSKAASKLVLDEIFAGDLERPDAERPARTGTILGLRSTRVYVQLDDPPVELKVYREDIEASAGAAYQLDEPAISLHPAEASGSAARTWRLGDAVTVTTAGYDRGPDRWRFRLAPAESS